MDTPERVPMGEVGDLPGEPRSVCTTPLDVALQLERDGFCYVALDVGTRRAVQGLFEASQRFHGLPEGEKEMCHHARYELKSGGWFRAGEEPVYDASDALGSSSRVEDFCVAAGARADPDGQGETTSASR